MGGSPIDSIRFYTPGDSSPIESVLVYTPVYGSPITLSQSLHTSRMGFIPRCQVFLPTISFECTTNLQVNFSTNISTNFTLKHPMTQFSLWIFLWAKYFTFLWLFSKFTYSVVAIGFLFLSKIYISTFTCQNISQILLGFLYAFKYWG